VNTSRLIWGVICLVLAAALGVLCIVLPPENLMFQIGDQNLPWIPAVVPHPEKVALNKRLENIGWGLFLIMWGGSALGPDEAVSDGWWSIGVGLIMLGLNVARYRHQIRMSGFTTFLGIMAIISGVLELMGLNDLSGAIFLIILGSYLIVKPWFDERQLFGKAEES